MEPQDRQTCRYDIRLLLKFKCVYSGELGMDIPCPMSQEVNMKIHYHAVAENFHFQFFRVVVDANLLFSFLLVNISLGIQSTELQTKLLLLLKYGALTSNGIPNRCSFVFF